MNEIAQCEIDSHRFEDPFLRQIEYCAKYRAEQDNAHWIGEIIRNFHYPINLQYIQSW